MNILVKRDKPRDLGLVRGEQPVQMVIDIRVHLHRATGVVCGGLGWIVVRDFRHVGRRILLVLLPE